MMWYLLLVLSYYLIIIINKKRKKRFDMMIDCSIFSKRSQPTQISSNNIINGLPKTLFWFLRVWHEAHLYPTASTRGLLLLNNDVLAISSCHRKLFSSTMISNNGHTFAIVYNNTSVTQEGDHAALQYIIAHSIVLQCTDTPPYLFPRA